MANDPHPVVRRDAAFALSYAGDPAVIPEMESALAAETEEQARLGLLQGLYALGQYERLAELLSHLQSTDGQVRHATINAIEDDARPEDREIVVEALQSLVDAEANPGVRADALRVMAAIRGALSPDVDGERKTDEHAGWKTHVGLVEKCPAARHAERPGNKEV